MNDLFIRMMQLGQKGFNCSQILLLLALEERGRTNPDLVRAMAGLAYGCGTGRAACGVLTGACALLAFWAEKENDPEQPAEILPMMLQELSDWFDQRVGQPHGGITCDAITGDAGPAASRQVCGSIVADTYAKALEIASDNGFYP